jgi:ATP-binding cassette subfamily A (ABC1) protein 3
MKKHLIDPEINRLLAALGLESKRDAKSRTLSGGMKRKLSVLIALCGGSKVFNLIFNWNKSFISEILI